MPDRLHLFCFGYSYSARYLNRRLVAADHWSVSATMRDPAKADDIAADGVTPVMLHPALVPDESVTHILVSAPPDAQGDPVLRQFGAALAALPHLRWLGYLSTTGVYGNHEGAWVDEETPANPDTERGRRRTEAEAGWLATGLPVHIFRLAGIYGPGRNPLVTIRQGKARRIIKPGQIFSRIHVEDIAAVLAASIASPNPGRIYNVCDDEPAPPADPIEYAAKLMGVEPPPAVPFEAADMSAMARSFYNDSKRVSNRRIREELGVALAYPTYREGLAALWANCASR